MKPLSKERLKYYNSRDARESDEIEELLAAEAYWREAVKKFGPWQGDYCQCCLSEEWDTHKDDCPWKLAQD